ncbi:MAG: FadR/GntR family transcriptional regulator [bacterium]|nr:FadR/GntR family transcriptional regulator [bacterium]
MSILFRRARQNRVYEDVVEQIQAAILDGKIAVGRRLPAERELCEQLHTSRGTVREALRILEQKGLIEIRLGASGGAYVQGAGSTLMAENLSMLLRSNDISLEHLEEFRAAIEGSAAYLAAQRITPEGSAELQQLLSRAETLFRQGLGQWDAFVRVDEAIHQAIARASANPLYDYVLGSIHANIHHFYNMFLEADAAVMQENHHDLTTICSAVINQKAEEAADLMRAHVRRFASYMQEKRR